MSTSIFKSERGAKHFSINNYADHFESKTEVKMLTKSAVRRALQPGADSRFYTVLTSFTFCFAFFSFLLPDNDFELPLGVIEYFLLPWRDLVDVESTDIASVENFFRSCVTAGGSG